MSDDKTEFTFGRVPENNQSENQNNNIQNGTPSQQQQPPIGGGFSSVLKDEGESKNKDAKMIVETSVSGLAYRIEVFRNGDIFDAFEVDCRELQSRSDGNDVFKQRYTAAHDRTKGQHISEEFFRKIASDEGDYIDGDEHCKIETFVSENTIKTVIYLDGIEFETKEEKIVDNIKSKQNILDKKTKNVHVSFVEKYLDKDKFPVNTFLNPLLEKLPLYDKNPMHAFWIFLALTVVLLIVMKVAFCTMSNNTPLGKLVKPGLKNAFGESLCKTVEKKCMNAKEAGWPKEMGIKPNVCRKACKNSILSQEVCKEFTVNKEAMSIKCKAASQSGWKDKKVEKECKSYCSEGLIEPNICYAKDILTPFSISPSSKIELDHGKNRNIYIRNNKNSMMRVRLAPAGIKIKDESGSEVTNVEIIAFLNGKTRMSVDPKEEGEFEILLEPTYIGQFKTGKYNGELTFVIEFDDSKEILHPKVKFSFVI
jgi:hypothetical protein